MTHSFFFNGMLILYASPKYLQLWGRMDLRVVCMNIATPTDVLSINELEHGKFDTGMTLSNIIWMIFGIPTFCTIILF